MRLNATLGLAQSASEAAGSERQFPGTGHVFLGMALLTQPAIALLDQLAERDGAWVDVMEFGRDAATLRAYGELQDARLIEVQTSVVGTGRRPPAWRRGPSPATRRVPTREARITWRGRQRLECIRAGWRRARRDRMPRPAADPDETASPGP